MMHQPSRVLHQSSVALRSVSQPNSHHGSRNGTTGVSSTSQTPEPHPTKGSQQYTKYRNNRSASSSRVVQGGLQAQIKTDSRVDCLRKTEARTCKNGGMENEPFATDRIPKMKLLKVNYVNLKNEETDKQLTSDKKETVTSSFAVSPAKHGKVLKEDIERKKPATAVGCAEKSTTGAKGVTNSTNNLADASAASFVGKKEKKECKTATTTTSCKEPEAKTGDPGKTGNSKYLVYKKHNGFGSANSPHSAESSTGGGAKLQYINDSDIKIKALAKKKYGLLFENKKKSKLETVQYYFDSRGYERYVDNKLYGVINEKKNLPDSQPTPGSGTATQPKLTDVQHKRLSWDVRQHNRPSMMRVINQSPAAKKCANVLMMNQQIATKPMSAEAPDTLGGGGGGGLKQENCRMFKLQKSHTSTNLLTRHKSMNDIHRINQLFLDSREDPDPLPIVSSPSRQSAKNGGDPNSPNSAVAVRDSTPVHRFEKHRKSEPSKYLVHKRLSARYKTESNLPKSVDVGTPLSTDNVTSCSLSGDDTISKRIRKIIDDQDRIVSTETLDQQPDETPMHELDRDSGQPSQNHCTYQAVNESVCSKRYRRLSKSKSADKLIFDSNRHAAEVLAKKEKNGNTCGYKNCKFSNCPMSSSSSASSASSTISTGSCSNSNECSTKTTVTAIDGSTPDQLDIVLCGKRTSIVINDSDDILPPATKEVSEYKNEKFVMNNLLNNGMLSGKMNNTHNCKDMLNDDDTEKLTTSTIKEIDLENNRMIIEKCLPHTHHPQNIGLQVSRQKFWNQQNQRNIKLKNNPQTKAYDDKIKINNKIKNEENNSIKIFISSSSSNSSAGSNGNNCASLVEPISLISTATANSNRSSSRSYSSNSSWGSTGSESDKDDGYYDQSERSISPEKQQPSSIVSTTSTDSSSSSTVCSESTNVSSVTCTKSLPASGTTTTGTTVTHNGRNRYTSKTSIRLGCDGSLFLNKSYLDEGELLPTTVTSDLEGDDNENGGCERQQSIGSSCCCCCRKRHQKFAHRTQPCLVSSIDITTNGSQPEGNRCAVSGVQTNDVVKHKREHSCACGSMKQINAQNKIENFSPRPRSIEGPLDSGISISSDTAITSSDSDLNLQSQTDSDDRKLKRGHVLAELLETERIYVAEMGSILKVKSTANYIVGKVHRRFGSIVSSRRMSSPTTTTVRDGESVKQEPAAYNHLPTACAVNTIASNGSESSSTLSYRASLFGEQDELVSLGCEREFTTMPRFSPRDFPTSWIGKSDGGTPFALQGILGTRLDESTCQPFGSRAHLFHKNKSITGKHGVLPFSQVEGAQIFANHHAYHSLKSSSTLRRTAHTFGGSCPEIHATSGTMRSQKSYKSQRSSNVSHTLGRSQQKGKSKIVQLLERNENEENDENTEMAILQEYFDTMSYTEIVKDRDFRNYLMKKRYLDIMEYIYNSSGASESGQFSRAASTVGPASLPVSNNDCDSVKKEKLMAESVSSPSTIPPPLPLPSLQRYYSSHTNSQVFCRRNSSFEQYYQTHGQTLVDPFDSKHPPGRRPFPSSRQLGTNWEREGVSVPPYATLLKDRKPKTPSRCQRTYRQIRAFCEKSLMKYSLNRTLNSTTRTLKSCTSTKDFSEKKYRRVIDDFVRQRGFSSVDEYTRYHYGDFLRQKLACSDKRSKRSGKVKKPSKEQSQQQQQQQLQYNSLPPPPYSSGDYYRAPSTPLSCESKTTPPLARNLSTNLLHEAGDRGDVHTPPVATSLPNVCDLISADTFKNFDYVNRSKTLQHNRTCRKAPSISSTACRLNDRRQIFHPVNSDGEDDPRHGGGGGGGGRGSPFLPFGRELLLGDVVATSDQTNRPYIFDDIGVYETIRSGYKRELKGGRDCYGKPSCDNYGFCSETRPQHPEMKDEDTNNVYRCDIFQKLVSN
uniref:DH domain-containing protein n=1 Tax=Anopheles culicifacies TaxID=139723 RepID=A0A182LX11_9DIPT